MGKRSTAPAADKASRNEATPPPPEAEPYRPEKPVHQVRMGLIRAAIWANVNAGGTWYNVTFARLYKDGNEWKSSDHYGRDDLLLLAKVADRVHSWIHQQQGQSS
jgi:hypothetical protein